MSDADLLRLLDEKLPGEFTPAELAALRARCAESPEVRAAIAAVLQLETDLATSFGEVSLAVDELIAKANTRRATVGNGRPLWWGMIGLTAVLLLVVGLFAWPLRPVRRNVARQGDASH